MNKKQLKKLIQKEAKEVLNEEQVLEVDNFLEMLKDGDIMPIQRAELQVGNYMNNVVIKNPRKVEENGNSIALLDAEINGVLQFDKNKINEVVIPSRGMISVRLGNKAKVQIETPTTDKLL